MVQGLTAMKKLIISLFALGLIQQAIPTANAVEKVTIRSASYGIDDLDIQVYQTAYHNGHGGYVQHYRPNYYEVYRYPGPPPRPHYLPPPPPRVQYFVPADPPPPRVYVQPRSSFYINTPRFSFGISE